MKAMKSLAALVTCAALAAPAGAMTSEAAWTAGSARFEASVLRMQPGQFRPMGAVGQERLTPDMAEGWTRDLGDTTKILKVTALKAAAAGPSADYDLASSLNRHLKTNLRYTLNGRSVWFSGAFDRAQKPFVAVLIDGYQPVYFDVKALLNQDQRLSIAGQAYTLSLSPNIFHRMKSTINLRADSGRDGAKFSVQDMLDSVAAAGQPLTLSDQAYKFYFADGLSGNGAADPSSRMFVFIAGDSKDFHVYLIPEKSVPSDKLGVFEMFNGKRVGLVSRGGRLQVYENP